MNVYYALIIEEKEVEELQKSRNGQILDLIHLVMFASGGLGFLNLPVMIVYFLPFWCHYMKIQAGKDQQTVFNVLVLHGWTFIVSFKS